MKRKERAQSVHRLHSSIRLEDMSATVEMEHMSQVERERPLLRKGSEASFVRWAFDGRSWCADLVSGQYRGATKTGWLLQTENEQRELSNQEWAPCMA